MTKKTKDLIESIKQLMKEKDHLTIKDAASTMGIKPIHFGAFLIGSRPAPVNSLKAFETYGVPANIIDDYNLEKTQLRRKAQPSKPVAQYTKEGKFLKLYPSSSAAAEAVGISSSHIQTTCWGKYGSAGGYLWRYTTLVHDLNEPTRCQHCGITVGGDEKVVIGLSCLQKINEKRKTPLSSLW